MEQQITVTSNAIEFDTTIKYWIIGLPYVVVHISQCDDNDFGYGRRYILPSSLSGKLICYSETPNGFVPIKFMNPIQTFERKSNHEIMYENTYEKTLERMCLLRLSNADCKCVKKYFYVFDGGIEELNTIRKRTPENIRINGKPFDLPFEDYLNSVGFMYIRRIQTQTTRTIVFLDSVDHIESSVMFDPIRSLYGVRMFVNNPPSSDGLTAREQDYISFLTSVFRNNIRMLRIVFGVGEFDDGYQSYLVSSKQLPSTVFEVDVGLRLLLSAAGIVNTIPQINKLECSNTEHDDILHCNGVTNSGSWNNNDDRGWCISSQFVPSILPNGLTIGGYVNQVSLNFSILKTRTLVISDINIVISSLFENAEMLLREMKTLIKTIESNTSVASVGAIFGALVSYQQSTEHTVGIVFVLDGVMWLCSKNMDITGKLWTETDETSFLIKNDVKYFTANAVKSLKIGSQPCSIMWEVINPYDEFVNGLVKLSQLKPSQTLKFKYDIWNFFNEDPQKPRYLELQNGQRDQRIANILSRYVKQNNATKTSSTSFGKQSTPYSRDNKRVAEIVSFIDEFRIKTVPGSSLTIVDIGAGDGNILGGVGNQFHIPKNKLFGIDPKLTNPTSSITKISSTEQLETRSVDVVLMLSMLHHVDNQTQTQVLSEVRRIVKPRGLVIIREHDYNGSQVFEKFIECVHWVYYIQKNEQPDIINMFSEKNLISKMNAIDFDLVRSVYYDRANVDAKTTNLQRLYTAVFQNMNTADDEQFQQTVSTVSVDEFVSEPGVEIEPVIDSSNHLISTQPLNFPYLYQGMLPPLQAMMSRLEGLSIRYPSSFEKIITKNQHVVIVNRVWPDDYVSETAIDGISNYFTETERMKCNKINKLSPQQVWDSLSVDRKKYYATRVLEFNDYVYGNICNNFNPVFCMYLIMSTVGRNAKILDPSSGWGDRLITAIASGAKEYLGTDPNIDLQSGYNAIINTLNVDPGNYKVLPTVFETSTPKVEWYDLALTSPPYFVYEEYKHSESSKTMTYERWMKTIYEPYLRLMERSVKRGGYIVLYVENFKYNNVVYKFQTDTANVYKQYKNIVRLPDIGLSVVDKTQPTSKPVVRRALVFRKK